MKFIIFFLSSLLALQSYAQFKRPITSEIQNANIICSNSAKNIEISVNTVKGTVWFRNLDSISRMALELQGPVFSGIQSSENYSGEVLGEIKLAQADYYVTIIMRNKNSNPEMETLLYPKADQSRVIKFFSDKCDIR